MTTLSTLYHDLFLQLTQWFPLPAFGAFVRTCKWLAKCGREYRRQYWLARHSSDIDVVFVDQGFQYSIFERQRSTMVVSIGLRQICIYIPRLKFPYPGKKDTSRIISFDTRCTMINAEMTLSSEISWLPGIKIIDDKTTGAHHWECEPGVPECPIGGMFHLDTNSSMYIKVNIVRNCDAIELPPGMFKITYSIFGLNWAGNWHIKAY